MAATHLPASQVCAPCPPPVDAAPVRHGGHNCRLLRGKKKTVSLLWQKKRKKEVLLTKKKKVVSADFFSGIKEKSSSSINYDTVSEARKKKVLPEWSGVSHQQIKPVHPRCCSTEDLKLRFIPHLAARVLEQQASLSDPGDWGLLTIFNWISRLEAGFGVSLGCYTVRLQIGIRLVSNFE